jgi:hypothetical protein
VIRRWFCWLLGHEPQGPIPGEYSSPDGRRTERVTYECARCAAPIRFAVEPPIGWTVVRQVKP